MIWTREKPTMPGWYWYREDKYAWITYVYESNSGLRVSEMFEGKPVNAYAGKWAGPIEEPKEQP